MTYLVKSPFPENSLLDTATDAAECLSYQKFLTKEAADALYSKLWGFLKSDLYRVTATHVDGCHVVAENIATISEATAAVVKHLGRKLSPDMGDRVSDQAVRAVDDFGGVIRASREQDDALSIHWDKLTADEQAAIIKAHNLEWGESFPELVIPLAGESTAEL